MTSEWIFAGVIKNCEVGFSGRKCD